MHFETWTGVLVAIALSIAAANCEHRANRVGNPPATDDYYCFFLLNPFQIVESVLILVLPSYEISSLICIILPALHETVAGQLHWPYALHP